jgi:YVTN family beta-propeller protein
MRNINLCGTLLVVIMLMTACSKESNSGNPNQPLTSGVYTLNQGNYNHNNTMLTYYDFTSGAATTDFFRNANGFDLGDTGSDFIIYGGKIYIVMNVSGYVAVTDIASHFIDTIDFKNAGVNRGPENIVAYGTNVFVSSTEGTVAVIDTTSLTVSKYITVGSNPAQMVVSGTNLCVSNTGGFSASFDSTVSIIDLHSLTETSKITVGINPGSLAADNAGYIYVACTGDYNTAGPKLVKVNTLDGTIAQTVDSAVGTVRFYNNYLLTTGGYLGSANVGYLSTADLTPGRPSFITDGTAIQNPYGVDVDPSTGDVYVEDAKNFSSFGEVFCFDRNGKKKFSYSVTPGVTPIKSALLMQ